MDNGRPSASVRATGHLRKGARRRALLGVKSTDATKFTAMPPRMGGSPQPSTAVEIFEIEGLIYCGSSSRFARNGPRGGRNLAVEYRWADRCNCLQLAAPGFCSLN